jgi:uncharacterized membrane protein
VVLVACPSAAAAAVIQEYAVDLRVRPDSRLEVTEAITVDFGMAPRHGIYRRIPVDYDRPVAGSRTRYSLRLRLVSVTDAEGQRHQVKTTRDGRYVQWRIGDPDRYVRGVQIYRIRYEVDGAINYFDEHDELYWNVTGTEWEWAIRSASARVTLPPGVQPQDVRRQVFTGYSGSTAANASVTAQGDAILVRTRSLKEREGLTVVLGFPKGVLREPGSDERLRWFFEDNAALLVPALFPILSLLVMLGLYLRHGRDPDAGKPIVVEYEPPKGLTPAEVGTLVDERADIADIVSTVVDLAVRGHLKIRQFESNRVLFFHTTDYEFTRLEGSHDRLTDHERRFLDSLFSTGDTVRLSDLKQKFYVHLPGIRDAIYRQLVQHHLFPHDPEKVRSSYGCGAGLLLLLAGVPIAILFGTRFGSELGVIATVGSVMISFAICTLFARAMPRKTHAGVKAARQALGFREFVRRVEQDRIRRMADEDPTIFERLLPYAMVLGAADEWAEKFQGLAIPPPQWYDSGTTGTFHTRTFVNDLGTGMTAMGSTFQSAPSSSSAGGGGSGFSGGSSGGGFGGGGGGGW